MAHESYQSYRYILLHQGVEAWNSWREQNPFIKPNLAGVLFPRANLSGANLSGVSLGGANLSGANDAFRAGRGATQPSRRLPKTSRRVNEGFCDGLIVHRKTLRG
jgi:hypothetical protein